MNIDSSSQTSWDSPDAAEILQNIRRMQAEIKAKDVLNMVFEYTEHVEPSKALLMNRSSFEDGRYRVFLHPDHEPVVEKALQEERERRNTP